jgi:DNA-binding response OmpR family regulator
MAPLAMFSTDKKKGIGSGRFSKSIETTPQFEVVLFEDTVLTADALAEQLRAGEYMICTCESATGALAEIVCSFPRCIIMDLRRPSLGGLGLLSSIRRFGFRVAVAVIVDPQDVTVQAELSALRPDAIFHKPLETDELSAWLHTISQESRRFW